MKTETILEAWDIASQEAEMYPDDFQKLVRANRIYEKLVNRIELGDKAIRILRQVKNMRFVDDFGYSHSDIEKYVRDLLK